MRRARRILLGALALTAATQCVSYTEGIEVDVAYQAPPMVSAIQTDRGYRVRLQRAMITLGEVELLFCDALAERSPQLFAASRARAHSATTPTQLGVPVIFDLMEHSGTQLFAGTMKPAPGRYCGVRATGAPADDDAVGSASQREAMLHATLLLEGTIESADGETVGPIEIRLEERIVCELWFAEPLLLDGPALSVALSVQLNPRQWFDGIDFDLQTKSSVQDEVVSNIRASLKATL